MMNKICEPIYSPLEDKDIEWKMISDQVMGGLSQGEIVRHRETDSIYDCLQGQVSLENNGGFIQMQLNLKNLKDLKRPFNQYDGIFIELKGNPHLYNLHFKSSQLSFPWQSFRKSVQVTEQWQRFFVPFREFASNRTFSKFNPAKVTRFAIVAIGEAFEAKVCVKRFGVYSNG